MLLQVEFVMSRKLKYAALVRVELKRPWKIHV